MPRSHQAARKARFRVNADGKRLGGPEAIRSFELGNQGGKRGNVGGRLPREFIGRPGTGSARGRPGIESPVGSRDTSGVRPRLWRKTIRSAPLPSPAGVGATLPVSLVSEPMPDDRTTVRADPLSVFDLGAVTRIGRECLPASPVGAARATSHRHLLFNVRRLCSHTSKPRPCRRRLRDDAHHHHDKCPPNGRDLTYASAPAPAGPPPSMRLRAHRQ